MPDISMCQNDSCPSRHQCTRYMAIPNPHRQTYASFMWDMDSGKCEYFSDVKDSPYILMEE